MNSGLRRGFPRLQRQFSGLYFVIKKALVVFEGLPMVGQHHVSDREAVDTLRDQMLQTENAASWESLKLDQVI